MGKARWGTMTDDPLPRYRMEQRETATKREVVPWEVMKAWMTLVPISMKTTSVIDMVRGSGERGTLENDSRVQVLLTEKTVVPLWQMKTSRGETGQRGKQEVWPQTCSLNWCSRGLWRTGYVPGDWKGGWCSGGEARSWSATMTWSAWRKIRGVDVSIKRKYRKKKEERAETWRDPLHVKSQKRRERSAIRELEEPRRNSWGRRTVWCSNAWRRCGWVLNPDRGQGGPGTCGMSTH